MGRRPARLLPAQPRSTASLVAARILIARSVAWPPPSLGHRAQLTWRTWACSLVERVSVVFRECHSGRPSGARPAGRTRAIGPVGEKAPLRDPKCRGPLPLPLLPPRRCHQPILNQAPLRSLARVRAATSRSNPHQSRWRNLLDPAKRGIRCCHHCCPTCLRGPLQASTWARTHLPKCRWTRTRPLWGAPGHCASKSWCLEQLCSLGMHEHHDHLLRCHEIRQCW
mmetsp:Transcript_32215/g.75656  ORF Transcript_32215/g.75656 Transcript_32215/m.75656 type:complete len:225 (+) Transcript_32215:989-1663(+)